jgi:hypothetical protein
LSFTDVCVYRTLSVAATYTNVFIVARVYRELRGLVAVSTVATLSNCIIIIGVIAVRVTVTCTALSRVRRRGCAHR